MTDYSQQPDLYHVPAQWAKRFKRIAAIADELGRLPRRSDDGIDSADVAWIADQRRSTTLTTQQQRALAQLPGWTEGTRDGSWYERAEDLSAFVAQHQRMPRIRTADGFERALAHWCSRQRVAARDGMLAPERAAALAYAMRGLPEG